jgi:hypothetical protein
MLQASLTRPPATNSRSVSGPTNISRTNTSKDAIASRADAMLQASLTKTSSASSTRPYDPPPPPYRNVSDSVLSSSSASLPRTRDRTELARPGRRASRPSVVGSSGSDEISSRLSAAEQNDRIRKVEQEVVKASSKVTRSTAGMFKIACSTDLLFLIDTTNSMGPYIEEAKNQIRNIVHDIHEAFLQESNIRVAVVGYTDHNNDPSVRFLDFTTDMQQVHNFLDAIQTEWGKDFPENVLGGIYRAVNSSWRQQTRCLIHIGDAPPHGRALHDFPESADDYYRTGSEPHGLTYEPLIQQLIDLKVNYSLLSIRSCTDRMALAFSRMYAAHGVVRLLPTNAYYGEMADAKTAGSNKGLMTGPRFSESKLGTSFSKLRQLVVSSVTASLSSTASRIVESREMTAGRSSGSKATAIKSEEPVHVETEKSPAQWGRPGWLSEMHDLEGFCPEVVVHDSSTLNAMIESDENIKIGVAQLTIRARPKPFSHGAVRTATYAQPLNTSNQFVIKSFIKDGGDLAEMVEDMRIQAVCKSFALEFNGLVRGSPIDFVVTMCLQTKGEKSSKRSISIEPYIKGDYIKYNNNASYVLEDAHPMNDTAQAFSHFTFERSWGHMMVVDLQGVGNQLTDPAIHTKDSNRFKLNPTNCGVPGFKLFFVTHECNHICRSLGLKSNREMAAAGSFTFRETWPALDPTVCCGNKLCRRIVRLANAYVNPKYPGHHWCGTCWPQLVSTAFQCICLGPGPDHKFEVSRFFYESQAQEAPKKCPEHIEKDRTVSNAGVVGSDLWNKMKASSQSGSVSGRAW